MLTLGLNEEGTLTHTVECSKMLSHNSSEPSHEYCNSLVDHSTQIGLSHLWQGQLHAFKLSYDNRRKTYIIDGHNTQIDYSVTLAAAFVAVDKDEKATLCRLVLSPDVDNPVLVFEHVVDSKDYVDVSPSVLRIEWVNVVEMVTYLIFGQGHSALQPDWSSLYRARREPC